MQLPYRRKIAQRGRRPLEVGGQKYWLYLRAAFGILAASLSKTSQGEARLTFLILAGAAQAHPVVSNEFGQDNALSESNL